MEDRISKAIDAVRRGEADAEALFALIESLVKENPARSDDIFQCAHNLATQADPALADTISNHYGPEVFPVSDPDLNKDQDLKQVGDTSATVIESIKSEQHQLAHDQYGPTIIASPAAPAHQAPRTYPSIGTTLKDRFELTDFLGSGGMGMVYRATDLRKVEAKDRNPYVAIKILGEEFERHPDAFITLQREARRAQSLRHPNIVSVFDFDRDADTVFIVMELLDGQTLSEIINDAGFEGVPFDEAIRIIQEVSDALTFAHQRGIVHCDLKPANIFLEKDGGVKVIDFGIARPIIRHDTNAGDLTVFDVGKLGALTPAFSSPQLLEGEDPLPSDDVFSLACITCQLLSGDHPYDRIEATKARDRGLKPLLPRKISAAGSRALQQALQFERQYRTKDVQSFVDALSRGGRLTAKMKATVGVGVLLVGIIVGTMIYLFESTHTTNETPVSETQAEWSTSKLNLPDQMSAPDVGQRPTPAPDKVPATALKEMPAPAAEAQSGASPEMPSVPTPSQGPKTAPTTDLQPTPPPSPIPAPGPSTALTPAPTPTPGSPDAFPPKLQAALQDPHAVVGRVLNEQPCSILNASINRETVNVHGIKGRQVSLTEIQNALSAVTGISSVLTEIQDISVTYCPTIELFKPLWLTNQIASAKVAVYTDYPGAAFHNNSRLVFSLKTPGPQRFIYADYYTLTGDVVHLLPSPFFSKNEFIGAKVQKLGDKKAKWIIGAPFGTELVIVVSSPRPLFPVSRPEIEKQDAYLADIRNSLDALVNAGMGDLLTADIMTIHTSP